MSKSDKASHPIAMTRLRQAEKKGRRFQNPVETKLGGLSIMLKLLPQYLTNREERVPREPLGPFQTDPRLYRSWPRSGLRVTWMGHASTLLEIDGVRLLVDPMWDERASPFPWMGPKRFFPPPLRMEDLPRIDAVLISHDHYDHLGKQTIRGLMAQEAVQGARWVTSVGVGKLLRRFGVPEERITELNWTESTSIAGEGTGVELTLTAVPARHFSGRALWNRFETLWSSFVLVGTRHRVFYGADSGVWEGFADIGQEYGPFDLTMLEVGAYNDLWGAIHMGPEGAAKAFAAMGGSGLLMPIHWGLFDLALHSWRDPIAQITALADKIGMRLWSPEPGAPTEVVAGREHRAGWWRGL
jgi:L-ascorbate metabolism protein UlaG (beta-lactamase superfamily)